MTKTSTKYIRWKNNQRFLAGWITSYEAHRANFFMSKKINPKSDLTEMYKEDLVQYGVVTPSEP